MLGAWRSFISGVFQGCRRVATIGEVSFLVTIRPNDSGCTLRIIGFIKPLNLFEFEFECYPK